MALDLDVSTELQELLSNEGDRGTARASHAWSAFFSWSERSASGWTVVDRIPVAEILDDPIIVANFLGRIEQHLGQAQHNGAGSHLSISLPATAPGGFDIHIQCNDARIDASFGGLDQEFPDVSSVMTWTRRALSRQYHLRILSISGVACEWRLAPLVPFANDGRVLASGRASLFSRFKRRQALYRRNVLLSHVA